MTDDFATLDATAQAELVRTGQVSPLELVDAAINRVEKLNPELNAVIHPLLRPGPQGGRRTAARRAVHRRADPVQGPRLRGRGRAVPRGHEVPEGRGLPLAAHRQPRQEVHRRRVRRRSGAPTPRSSASSRRPSRSRTAPTHNPWKLGHTTGGSSGGSAAAVASGMVAGRARERRRRLDPHPRVVLRARRAEADPRSHVDRPGHQRDLAVPRHRPLREPDRARHRRRCSTRSTVRSPATRRPRAPPSRPYRDEVGADPGKLRIGLQTTNPIGDTPVHADCVAAAEDAAKLLESLGHSVEVAAPKGFDNEELIMQFGAVWAADCAYLLDDWGKKVGREVTADDVEILTWALAEMGKSVTAARARRRGHRRDEGQPRRRAVLGARAGGRRLRPAAHPDARRAAGARTARSTRRPEEPLGGFFRSAAFVPFTAQFNVSGQPGDQPAAALERRRAPDRHPARRRVRSRGPAAPGRRAARDRAALDRPPPTRLRLTSNQEAAAMGDDLAQLDATAQAELVRNGDATPTELVTAAIDRIEELQPKLNALTTNRFERALEEAKLADDGDGLGRPDAPFRGVPFLVKDLAIPMAGEPAHEGMRALKEAGWTSPRSRATSPAAGRRPGSSSSAARTRPSSGSCRRPSPRRTGRPATRGTPTARPAGRVAGRRPRSRAGWCRPRTRATAAVRSASPPRAAGSSA